MKVNTQNSNQTESTKESNSQVVNKQDEECLSSCNTSFKELINIPKNNISKDESLLKAINNSIIGLNPVDIKSDFNYDTFSMDKDDAMFFVDMVNNGQFALNLKGDINASLLQLTSAESTQATYKSASVSKTLLNLMETSLTTNKPVRIDFDNNVAVILKIDKSGAISANFIPGDKAVEQYLRDNIAFLRQRFDDQNLSYSDLSYSQHKGQGQKQKKDNNKGE